MSITGDQRVIFMMPRASGFSGGVKTLLEHVRVLRGAGYDALAYDENGALDTDYGLEVPVAKGSFKVQEGDVVVRGETFPEDVIRRLARTAAKQVIFVQNHHYVYNCLGAARSFDALGVHAVAASSRHIRSFLIRHGLAADVTYLPYAVELPVGLSDVRRPRIAYMPRKIRRIASEIRGLFPVVNPDLRATEWISIDGVPHDQAMRELAKSSVFLSLHFLEGFGLPALEAMAAGCVVAGFSGGPGCEYVSDRNGLWVDENDIEGAAVALGKALRWSMADSRDAKEMIAEGRVTAAGYSVSARDERVLAFYGSVLSMPSGKATG